MMCTGFSTARRKILHTSNDGNRAEKRKAARVGGFINEGLLDSRNYCGLVGVGAGLAAGRVALGALGPAAAGLGGAGTPDSTL